MRFPVIAKSVSSGVGLAPHPDQIDESVIPLLVGAPTVLQRMVVASADLRVVTVGRRAWIWRRERVEGAPIDWRLSDPTGSGFRYSRFEELEDLAISVTAELGLTTSVQDWALDKDSLPWFLEANPVGQWLFLEGAEETVAPAVAAYLANVDRGMS